MSNVDEYITENIHCFIICTNTYFETINRGILDVEDISKKVWRRFWLCA